MKSVMSHNFSQVPKAEIQRSSFDRSHGYKTTLVEGGVLYPVFVDEALPGDTFNLKMSAFARLATPLKPIMDNLFLDSFFFAVPYRLVWDNWQKFNGEQTNPGDPTDFSIPIVSPAVAEGNIADYMGIPPVAGLEVNALPFRAYIKIWNDWFRDQNLQDSIVLPTGDGPDAWSSYYLLRRGKRHDYFTSCLPWPQKHEDVLLPLGAKAPVEGIGIGSVFANQTYSGTIHESGHKDRVSLGTELQVNSATSPWLAREDASNPGYPDIYANLAAATSAKINQLREAFQLQRLFERDARGGTRYTEIIRAHFGVTSPDARLQRPEYLGGGTTPISIHPVAQTSASGTYADSPQGNLAGFGTVAANNHGFSKSFTEHCIIIGLVSVRADLTYQQGLNRMWSRKTRYDHYWPALAHLGEQAVLNKEIYAQGTAGAGVDEGVFGYQERYGEYRYKPSLITGQFRSASATSLDIWHLSQDFGSLPTLTDAFIKEQPPIDRIIAVPSEPAFLFDSYFQLTCARPMPVFGVPGFIDHF